ncbi:hypothetical protein CDAR_26881, partial [Caerostris darwini]
MKRVREHDEPGPFEEYDNVRDGGGGGGGSLQIDYALRSLS